MRRLSHIVLMLVATFALHAEMLQPVHWSAQRIGDSVRFVATIDSGWHMTLISIGDSMVGEEFAMAYHISLPLATEEGIDFRYNACDDQQCTAPELFHYPVSSADNPALSAGTSADHQDGDTVSIWYLFLMGLLGGFLAIFTPCIWPIIPMTVSFFLKQSSSNKAWRDALLYGLSIVLIYVGVGLVITLAFGASALNQIATSAIANIFFFALLVLFALSFFGLFEITLPSSWSSRMDASARKTRGVMSIVLMALTLVIVSFSCTGPIIGTLLVEAAGRSLLAPAIGMLGFSLALALPFALFAMFPEWMKRLPKSGGWMQSFKVTLAFVELALSLKFLSVADMAYGWGILPRWLFIALWIGCFLGLGIYLIRKSWVGKVLALVSWGFVAYLVPGLWGAPVRAIAAFAPPMPIEEKEVFIDYEEGMTYARQTGKPVLLQFSGYGCVNCRKMEQFILMDADVKAALRDYVRIVLYVDSRQDNNRNGIVDGEEYSRLQREQFGSNAQPYWIQLSPAGETMGEPLAFTTDPKEFLSWLRPLASPAINIISF